jgi:hypothetical protein
MIAMAVGTAIAVIALAYVLYPLLREPEDRGTATEKNRDG